MIRGGISAIFSLYQQQMVVRTILNMILRVICTEQNIRADHGRFKVQYIAVDISALKNYETLFLNNKV